MEPRDVMTPDPACCSPSDSVKDAAALMVGNDCGEIPVVDEGGQLVGVITDRDIACRCVAEGKSADTPVEEVMSSSLVTVTRSEEHTSELQSLMRISYAVFCLKKKNMKTGTKQKISNLMANRSYKSLTHDSAKQRNTDTENDGHQI